MFQTDCLSNRNTGTPFGMSRAEKHFCFVRSFEIVTYVAGKTFIIKYINPLFVRETLKQRENGLPENLMVIENCDEYVVCINADNGNIVSWSNYVNDGMIVKQTCFEDYFIDCIENAIGNYDDDD